MRHRQHDPQERAKHRILENGMPVAMARFNGRTPLMGDRDLVRLAKNGDYEHRRDEEYPDVQTEVHDSVVGVIDGLGQYHRYGI